MCWATLQVKIDQLDVICIIGPKMRLMCDANWKSNLVSVPTYREVD